MQCSSLFPGPQAEHISHVIDLKELAPKGERGSQVVREGGILSRGVLRVLQIVLD